MAVGIQNYPNIDTSNPTDFPNGMIKDDPLGVNGTPITVDTTGDIHFTFDKIIRESGSVANGSPDAEGGAQYWDAMRGLFGLASLDPSRPTLAGDSLAFAISTNINYTNPTGATNSINLITSAIPDVPGNRCHIIVATTIGHTISFSTPGNVFLATGGASLTATASTFFVIEIEYFGIVATKPTYIVKAYTT